MARKDEVARAKDEPDGGQAPPSPLGPPLFKGRGARWLGGLATALAAAGLCAAYQLAVSSLQLATPGWGPPAAAGLGGLALAVGVGALVRRRVGRDLARLAELARAQ